MITKNTSHYNFRFYDKYVIAEAIEGANVDNKIVAESLKIIFDHYKGDNFTLISHRKNNYTIDIDVYTLKLMKKLRALAIVSGSDLVKERAIAEQMAFNKSFAFFENLEDAEGWAQSAAIQ